MILEKILSSKN